MPTFRTRPAPGLPPARFLRNEMPSASALQALYDAVRGINARNGLSVVWQNGTPVLDASLLDDVPFGWGTVSGQTVTITNGIVMASGAYVKLGDTVVNVGGNSTWPHLILATGDPHDSATWRIEPDSVEEDSFTGHSATRFRRPLYRVWLDDGSPVYSLRIQSGVIDLQQWESP